MIRLFIAAACVVGWAASSEAAEVKKLVITCVEKAEATPDDVFIEFERDGRLVPFTKEQQAGLSRDNTAKMTDGDVLTLEPGSLAALTFEKSLVIHLKDKDITRDEPIARVTLQPGDVTESFTAKGKDVGSFEYRIEYTTTK